MGKKKSLLNEQTIEKFFKLAGIQKLKEEFDKNFSYEDEEEEEGAASSSDMPPADGVLPAEDMPPPEGDGEALASSDVQIDIPEDKVEEILNAIVKAVAEKTGTSIEVSSSSDTGAEGLPDETTDSGSEELPEKEPEEEVLKENDSFKSKIFKLVLEELQKGKY